MLSACVLVTRSCRLFATHGLYSPPASSLPGTLQPRTLEWVAIPFSRGSSWPRDGNRVSCIAGKFFTLWAEMLSIWYLKSARYQEPSYNPGLRDCTKGDACVQEFLAIKDWIPHFRFESLINWLPCEDILPNF